MEKICVILGAGASYDIHNGSVPVTNGDLRPPLAKELFGPRFWSWRKEYPGAELLGAELGRQASSANAPFDLEAKLTEFELSDDDRIRQAFKDIPPYLRDVLVAVSTGYVPSPTSHLVLVRRLLASRRFEAGFVLLNYDTLLEDALHRFDSSFYFKDIGDYVVQNRQAKVFKIHGSVNWAVPMGLPTKATWRKALMDFDPATRGLGIAVVDGTQSTPEWRHKDSGRYLYPRLTAPVREKTFTCPDDHTTALAAFLDGCHRFLVIGTSGLDLDLLQFLDTHIQPNALSFVHFVDYGAGVEAMRRRFEDSVRCFGVAVGEVFEDGYTAYLDSPNLERLLRPSL